MNKIDDEKHNELIIILSELIETIELMKKEEKDYLLIQNENEARDRMDFLKNHTDKDELKSLENEISDRFFFKFDVQIGTLELDNKRAELMKKYIFKSNEYLKMLEYTQQFTCKHTYLLANKRTHNETQKAHTP